VPRPAPVAPVAVAAVDPHAEALGVFTTRCTACHGARGAGDGAAAAALNPKPANFTLAAWQKSVTDDQIEKVIVAGGAALGKSPLMTANPDLKPEVVKALREHVRSLVMQ
jgi:mono/diheme cytochrome c family protein